MQNQALLMATIVTKDCKILEGLTLEQNSKVTSALYESYISEFCRFLAIVKEQFMLTNSITFLKCCGP